MVCKEGEGTGKFRAGHGQRAVMKISPEHFVDITYEVAVTLEEMRHGRVAVAGFPFRSGDLEIEGDAVAAGEFANKRKKAVQRVRLLLTQAVSDDDGTSIDEGIARNTFLVFELNQGVVGIARRLNTYTPPQPLSHARQNHSQGQYFRHTLDG